MCTTVSCCFGCIISWTIRKVSGRSLLEDGAMKMFLFLVVVVKCRFPNNSIVTHHQNLIVGFILLFSQWSPFLAWSPPALSTNVPFAFSKSRIRTSCLSIIAFSLFTSPINSSIFSDWAAVMPDGGRGERGGEGDDSFSEEVVFFAGILSRMFGFFLTTFKSCFFDAW